ncbi:Putative superfamily I DNA helicases [Halomonas citrativorans]|uniref:Superfamily I DNA helicases n=1 Tax=Halomonas citrativorans TaxID=2742612 RepID=A0A1R4I3D9_9GAMM|nr:AAA domain-containing protein [Halomonas citrativorans]SJN14278.1 Putative superfamily I DNA helicases [Halomonas citrativorans]
MSQAETSQPMTKQWLRYWRNSLADAESGRGALTKKALGQTDYLERTVYRDGRLPSNHPVLQRLFEEEDASTKVVRVALRPAVYKVLQEHGTEKRALYPDVITPLICGLWVSRDGRLIPAEPPVIPRDLLAPQADDRFTLNDVAEQDRFLSKSEPQVWSESEAMALLEDQTLEVHGERWQPYYELSQKLFDTLCPKELLKDVFVSANEARITKVDDQLGAATHIIKLYDWLSTTDQALPLLESYALSHIQTYQPRVEPLDSMPLRLGHANSQYPLAIAQRDALAQVMAMEDGEILAVNGPPGTGKTTFVLSAIASLWVKAALDEAEPPLIVAASTNNQAVTNVLEAFAKDFEETQDAFGGRWLPEITSYGGYYCARSKEGEASKHYQTPSFYREVESPEYLERAEMVFVQHAREAFDDDSLTGVDAVRKRLHQRLTERQAQLDDFHQRWSGRATLQAQLAEQLGDAPDQTLEREQAAIIELQGEFDTFEADLKRWQHFCADEPMWLSLLAVLPPVAKKRRMRRELFISEHLSGEGQRLIEQSPSAEAPENALKARLDQQRAALDEKQAFVAECRQTMQAIEQATAALEAAFSEHVGKPLPATFDAFDQALDTTLRFNLFQLAVHYWEARWLEACAERADELAEQTAKGKEKQGLATVRPRWRRRMMLTPCIVSTLHSLPSHMIHKVFEGPGQFRPDYLINEIDLLIIDEAGQVAPDVAGASMALTKRVLAIGDVHQIKPVATQSPTVDVGNLSHQGLLTTVDEYEKLREGGRSVVDGSVMRIAQHASRYHYLEQAEPGMFLREHRRCLNEIIAYCNDLCYQGLLQPLRNKPATDTKLPPFGYVHVDGRAETPPSGSRINRLEAITIAEWLADQRERLEATHGKPLEQIIGVVTPFKAQANLIEQECLARDIRVGDGDAEMTVGTVHALQGAERPVVLFSAVYSRHDDGSFIDNDPSILNVAVSRAKDSFLVFGDMDVIGTAAHGTPRHLLGRYLFSHEDNELAFTASVARPDLLALCQTPRLINDAEAHDQLIKDLLERVQHQITVVSPWLSLDRLEQTGLLAALQQTADRGVGVMIYTDHHFNTTRANRPDEEKTASFERCCEMLAAEKITVNVVNQVHSKLVMADKHVLCVGSYNWASAAREGKYKNMETSMLYSGNLEEEIELQREALKQRVRKQYPEPD